MATVAVRDLAAAARFYEDTLGLARVGEAGGRAVVYRSGGSRGVRFERYDLPGTTREGDVHVSPGMRAAWFTDPDGNIHALASG